MGQWFDRDFLLKFINLCNWRLAESKSRQNLAVAGTGQQVLPNSMLTFHKLFGNGGDQEHTGQPSVRN